MSSLRLSKTKEGYSGGEMCMIFGIMSGIRSRLTLEKKSVFRVMNYDLLKGRPPLSNRYHPVCQPIPMPVP
jgi:hypothetical protein